MKKILCSAQSFGYGPVSKLVTLVKLISSLEGSDVEVDFVGDSIALIYVQQNKNLFNKITSFSGTYPDLQSYDLVISVMEPHLAIWSSLNNKKTFYVDSLFWFWSWDNEHLNLIENSLKNNTNSSTINKWKHLTSFDDHHLQYIAHKLSDYSLTQTFINVAKKEDSFREKIGSKEIGAIIDTTLKRKNLKRNKIIVSLSGLLSPLNKIENAIKYSELVLTLLGGFIRQLPEDIEIILTTNPLVASQIKVTNDRIKIKSLSHDELLNLLNESILLFAPVGITTLYESLLYDVPIIFLPEQHDGHFSNYSRLMGDSLSLNELRKIFPEMLFNTRINRKANNNPDQEIGEIQSLINNFDKENALVEDMKKVLKKVDQAIKDENVREKLLSSQQKTVLTYTSIFTKEKCREIFGQIS
ncbi:MAG: hypothetical protein WAV41_01555 [Microgenomates group bacterium]